ncbi:Imm26 family immunity protein [Streptosporangium sp. NPDC000095]|uniref:Imm26 family immunity protein n=1 Tax=Streptosporangium sp. NPDC000095 TaxID=3366184 RepID=UPI00368A6E3B
MNDGKLHFETLKSSRKHLASGDLFTFSIKSRGNFFGRVIIPSMPRDHPLTDAACLIHIYAFESPGATIDHLTIDTRPLLIPPLFTNRRPWTMGYFQTLTNIPLGEHDMLKQHCFLDLPFCRYVDEMRRPTEGKVIPCGTFGVASYSAISSEVGRALGLPTLEGPEDY